MKDIFCRIIEGEIPSTKIYEDDDVLVILDISQTTKGHALVLPKAHCDNVLDCPKDLLDKIFETAQKVAKAEIKAFGCQGVNILTNAGEKAGQSVMHFHVHVIPRYNHQDGLKMEFKENAPEGNELQERASLLRKELDA